VAEMKKRKLNVITLDAPTLASWKQEADKAYPSIRGSVVPADLFDRARQLITEIRSKR
jgi:hypothetical protein